LRRQRGASSAILLGLHGLQTASWLHKDLFGFTLRRRTDHKSRALPGAAAADQTAPPHFPGTPYFTASPGDRFKAWDGSATFDYMPSQFTTFRF